MVDLRKCREINKTKKFLILMIFIGIVLTGCGAPTNDEIKAMNREIKMLQSRHDNLIESNKELRRENEEALSAVYNTKKELESLKATEMGKQKQIEAMDTKLYNMEQVKIVLEKETSHLKKISEGKKVLYILDFKAYHDGFSRKFSIPVDKDLYDMQKVGGKLPKEYDDTWLSNISLKVKNKRIIYK